MKRLFAGGMLAGWMGRAWIAISQLIAIRLWTQEIGLQGYAAIVVLLAMQGWLMLLDLGMGPILQNRVAKATATNAEAVSDIHAAVHILCVSAVIGGLLWCIIAVPLSRVLPHEWTEQVAPHWPWTSMAVAGILWSWLPTGQLIYRIWFGEGRGWLSFALPAVAQGMGCLAIWMLPSSQDGSQVLLHAIAWILPQILLPLAFLIHRYARITRIDHSLPYREIFRESKGFALFALLGTAIIYVDVLVLAAIIPAAELVEYNIIQRVFQAAMSLVAAAISSVQPSITANLAIKNTHSIYTNVRHCLVIGCGIMGLAICAMLVARNYIAHLLVPNADMTPRWTLIGLLGLYWFFRIWTDTWAGVLTAASHSRPLLFGVLVQGPCTWLLLAIGIRFYGVHGAALALTGGFALTVAWWLPMAAMKRI